MTTYSARSAVTAFGKQSAEGTARTTPAFEIPMGGGFAGPERSTAELPWTNETQDAVGDYVERHGGLVDMTLPVLPVSSVALFEAVLGSRATTGAGPYTHAITPSDSLPFFTFFYAQPGGNYWQVTDTKIGAATLNWSPGSPLELAISGNGKTVTRAAATWTTATLDEGVDPFYTYIGATMKFDSATTPASTTVSNIAGGSVSINRNLDPIQTDDVTYSYNAENKRDIEVSLDDVVFENNDLINSIFTGTTTGTTMSGQVVYGSCEFTFIGSDQTAAATRSLKVALPRVPSADPGGSTLRYTVTGRASKPSSGASITVTAINASAAGVYA
jgi:hypothetical protein